MDFTIYLLELVAFVDLFAVGLILPLIPPHARRLGANHLVVGLLGSIYAGFQLGSGPLMGSFSDIKGRKTLLITTLLVCGVAYSTLGITTSVAVILLIRAALGLFKQTQMLIRAMVPDYERCEAKQGEIYGRLAAISGAGITMGPTIGGHILENNGFQCVSMIVGICFALNAGLVYFLPKSIHVRKKKRNVLPARNFMVSLHHSFKQSFVELSKVEWSLYWDVFMFKALVGFAMGAYYSNYAAYLGAQFGLTPKYIGYVISFQGVIGSFTSYFIGVINKIYNNDRDYSQRNFHVFVLLSVSLLGLILSPNVYTYAACLVPLAISNAVARLVTLEMVLKRSSGHHIGTLIGASNSVRSLSGVVSPMAAGIISEYAGVVYVTYVSFAAAVVGLSLSYQYRNKVKIE